MHLTKESEELLAALRANTCSPAHEILLSSVSKAVLGCRATFTGHKGVAEPDLYAWLQKGSSARLQELVQTWPTAAKEDLSQAVLHQVTCE
jgi:hypothetical protein